MFLVKLWPYGTMERYKVSLEAKVCTQTYVIDYQETFTPLAKINSTHILISLAANQGWPLLQLDS